MTVKEAPGIFAVDVSVSGLLLPKDAELFLHWLGPSPLPALSSPRASPLTHTHRTALTHVSVPRRKRTTHRRGTFRESSAAWQRLPTLPPGSTYDSALAATRTLLKPAANGGS